MNRRTAFLATLTFAALLASAPRTLADPGSASAGFPASTWIAANQPFEITLDGVPADARLAVMLDTLDITSLCERIAPERVRYHGRGPTLPAGTHTLRVHEVEADGTWRELGAFPIRLLSPRGFVSTRYEPAGDLTGKGQFGAQEFPLQEASERAQFHDATARTSFRTELVRPSFTLKGEAQVAGVTFQNEALRFSTERERAPRVDLAGYRVDVQRGTTVFSAGHLNIGSLRHLITGFQSRGLALTVGEGRTVSLQLALLNGSNIVGWDNVLGLQSERHRIWSATAGLELRPSQPGAMRMELGLFRGSSEPLTGFNQGGVVTAETSRGGAVRLQTSAVQGRLRVDAGVTRSRFDDSFDAEVEQDIVVTPIEERTAAAQYADVSVDLLQSRAVLRTKVSASLRLRHEEIEPNFRSLGAPVQANLRTDGVESALSIGSVSATFAHTRTQDNLGRLDSLITNRTRRSTLQATIPLSSMLRAALARRFSPTISLQADSVHQFGDELPASGDFTIFDLPDQKSRNLQASLDWQLGVWRVGTRFTHTLQDNQQLGNETRDFVTNGGALSFDWAPQSRFSFGGEAGLDRNRSEEQQQTDSTFRWTARTNVVLYREVTLAATVSNDRAWDDLETRDSKSLDTSIELSSGFRLSRTDRRKGRIFIRWVERSGTVHERQFGLQDARRNSAFATGLTLRVF